MRAATTALLTTIVLLPAAAMARDRKPAPVMPIGQSASYRCADGRTIELLFAGDGSALLTAGSETATLKPVDRSGARFQGDGWRWTSASATSGSLAHGVGGRNVGCAVG